MLGYTGSFQGIPISVMGTGMGIPSASIYATELVTEYGVERLVRVGSCGGILPSVKIRDVILAIGACTDSGVNRVRYGGLDFAATADFGLLRAAAELRPPKESRSRWATSIRLTCSTHRTRQLSIEWRRWESLRSRWEAAGLYGVAAEKGARALTIATVSDHVRTGESTSPEERQQTFNEMVEIALDAIGRDIST